MEASFSPFLTQPDVILLKHLKKDLYDRCKARREFLHTETPLEDDHEDLSIIDELTRLNDESSDRFQPTIFTSWDRENIPETVDRFLVQPYSRWAQTVTRRPTDVVFLTHILLYLITSVPSAIFLYYDFTWLHGVLHWAVTGWYCGSFTLMLHNHIHNNGVLAKKWAWFDQTWPYLLEPLMGHTWNSYYYHHVKHHHVENNGPGDLSSTIRYQRDDVLHFLCYVGRFLFFAWIELPIYFARKKKPSLAIGRVCGDMSTYTLIYALVRWKVHPTIFVFILPLIQMRIAMMVGNWGQHALVDEVEPDSDFRSSITLIDVPSNRHCFNDGYHTSHHLNPRRHWRDHPAAFAKAKVEYRNGRALVFQNIDYVFMTVHLLRKDYMHLASCLVPIGDQVHMSQEEIATIL